MLLLWLTPLTPLSPEGRQLLLFSELWKMIQHSHLPDAYRQLLACRATLADPKLTPGRPIIASY